MKLRLWEIEPALRSALLCLQRLPEVYSPSFNGLDIGCLNFGFSDFESSSGIGICLMVSLCLCFPNLSGRVPWLLLAPGRSAFSVDSQRVDSQRLKMAMSVDSSPKWLGLKTTKNIPRLIGSAFRPRGWCRKEQKPLQRTVCSSKHRPQTPAARGHDRLGRRCMSPRMEMFVLIASMCGQQAAVGTSWRCQAGTGNDVEGDRETQARRNVVVTRSSRKVPSLRSLFLSFSLSSCSRTRRYTQW